MKPRQVSVGGKVLPEVYFLRYAFPCARVLVDVRKTLDEEGFDELKRAVETDTPIDRERLERIFPKAMDGLRRLDDDFWDVRTIRRYFWSEHEAAISKDLPGMIRRLCVVRRATLTKYLGDSEGRKVFQAEIDKDDVRTVAALYPCAGVDDKVMVHYGYAVEKVD